MQNTSNYLDRFQKDKQRVRDLFRPLAYAEGSGLLWENLWAPLASAIAGVLYTDSDIEWLLDHAGAYVVEGTEEGRSVYRLYHQALTDHLRLKPQNAEIQRRFTNTLREQTPNRISGGGKDWLRASPYVRQHLAAHAAQAGMLGKLVADPLYVVAAEPDRLLRALIFHSQDLPRELVHVYQRAIHHLRTPSFAERASYLEMDARQSGFDAFADQIGQLPLRRSFSVPWANWQPEATHRVISGHEDNVHTVFSVAVGELEGRAVVVSGGWDGTVRVWDLASGRARGEPLRGHEGSVLSVAAGELEGRAVIVSGGVGGRCGCGTWPPAGPWANRSGAITIVFGRWRWASWRAARWSSPGALTGRCECGGRAAN